MVETLKESPEVHVRGERLNMTNITFLYGRDIRITNGQSLDKERKCYARQRVQSIQSSIEMISASTCFFALTLRVF